MFNNIRINLILRLSENKIILRPSLSLTLLFFERGSETLYRNLPSAPSVTKCQKLPERSQAEGANQELNPGSHMGGRESSIQALSPAASRGIHQQEVGIRKEARTQTQALPNGMQAFTAQKTCPKFLFFINYPVLSISVHVQNR